MLLDFALEHQLEGDINAQIRAQYGAAITLQGVREQLNAGALTPEIRSALGKAAGNKPGWFKSVGAMEHVAREIVFPHVKNCDRAFISIITDILTWSRGDARA